MPISPLGNPYFTDAQYRYARDVASALEYAKSAGYDLVREGSMYRHRDHSSMVFTPNGRWFWNSHQLCGGAIECIMACENKSLVEAVLILNGESLNVQQAPLLRKRDVFRGEEDIKNYFLQQQEIQKLYAKPLEEIAPVPFELPEKSESFRRLFAYLCEYRKLDSEIVSELVKEKRIYESCVSYIEKPTGEIKYNHNAVFLGLDEHGVPRHAFQRGLNSYSKFKNDVPGSDFNYFFHVPGYTSVSEVYVFEAAIDAISHASICKSAGGDYKTADRISLDGTSSISLLSYLRSHSEVKNIVLATDNDDGGMKAVKGIMRELTAAGYTAENGYNISREIPPFGKDWNDYLRQSWDPEKRRA